MVTDMTAQYTPGEHVVDAAAGHAMQGYINDNLNEINKLWARQDYIKIRGNGVVTNQWTQIPITGVSIGKGNTNSEYFGTDDIENPTCFYFKRGGIFLEVAQTYTAQTNDSNGNPKLYKSNASVFIRNDLNPNTGKMGVGVTTFNYGDNDNVSAESITISGTGKYAYPTPLVLAGYHTKPGGMEMSMTITLVPLYPRS